MQFTTDAPNTIGAHQQGQIATDYDTLVEAFGEPNVLGPTLESTDNKVTCMWAIQFDDGTVATIYDWNTISTPFHLHSWIIGGFNSTAVDRVLETIDLMKVDFAWDNKTEKPPAKLDSIISIIETGLSKLKTAETPMQTAEYLNSLGDILKYHALKIENGQSSQ